MSEHTSQRVRGDNSAPEFDADQDPVMPEDQPAAAREVPENSDSGTFVGDPVTATDDDDDTLTYTLWDADGGTTGASASFSIDRATGQIETTEKLDHEGEDAYEVVVRATDPAGIPGVANADRGSDNSDIVTVNITVTDVDEVPVITGDAAVSFDEETGNFDTTLDMYTATDLDVAGEDETKAVNTATWATAGPDGSKFTATGGDLQFKAQPDYEKPTDANKDNVYEVTVTVADERGERGMMKVKVTVTDAEEPGVVTLSKTQPRVGIPITASLSDPDGSVTAVTWQWSNGDGTIEGETTDTYKPVTGDVDKTLTATAKYFDGHSEPDAVDADKKTAMTNSTNPVAADTRNKAPAFEDQDDDIDGVQNESTTRKVDENTKANAADDSAADDAENTADNVGGVVTATDPDPNDETPQYSLSGTDAMYFRVREDTGQIEVGASAKLDYETKPTYMVTLTAADSFSASSSIVVTIMVNDVDEAPDVSGDEEAEYAENSTGPVATYTATDPEGASVSWSLGTDTDDESGLFDISDGVLTFKDSPDYEDPPADVTENEYMVTIMATDETNKVATEEVTVTVTNVDEAGTVTLSALRPQSSIAFTATLSDKDDGVTNAKWQWSKSRSRNGSYSNIDKATSTIYMPKDDDEDYFLKATAMYTDGHGSDKEASGMSEHTSQRVRGNNSAPEFDEDQDPVMPEPQAEAEREVPENSDSGTFVGDPVTATDDDDDTLTYTLWDTVDGETTGDSAFFSIDRATGQIETAEKLDHEVVGHVGNNVYTVVVRATDPAGIPGTFSSATDADNSDTVTVNITVTDVDEVPVITTGTEPADFNETTGDFEDMLATYVATDQDVALDGETDKAVNTATWATAGPDGSKFTATGGDLQFKAQPDYEKPTDANKDNVYEVTVTVADERGERGMMKVKVTVTDAEEPGVVTLSKTQPRVGIPITASLSDPDGSVTAVTWQWSNGDGTIEGETTDTYKPVTGDVDKTLTATAKYFDGHSEPDAVDADKKTAMTNSTNPVAADTRNKAPAFEDQDDDIDGVQNESTTRKVDENTKANAADDSAADDAENTADNVGGVVTATDPDPNDETPQYSLSGTDAMYFRVREDTGQIEVGASAKLDYETKPTYMVTLTAADSFSASSSIVVTIMVNDVDEAPEIMTAPEANVGPEFDSAMDTRSVAENSQADENIGVPFQASDANLDTLTYTLGGADATSFTIDSATGQLMTSAALDYETRATYTVTVRATDPDGESDAISVTVTVTNVDEPGTVSLAGDPQVGVELTASLADIDGNVSGEAWQWARDDGEGGDFEDIADATSEAYTPVAEDEGKLLRATVTYTDGEGAGKSAMATSAAVALEAAVSGRPSITSAENNSAALETYTFTGPESASATWSLSGDDAGDFSITDGVLAFGSAPNYEAPADANMDNVYSVTVVANDGTSTAMLNVTVTVTNVDERGTVSLSGGDPQVGVELTASLTDPDGSVSGMAWQWARDDGEGGFEDIAGATSAAYTPDADDAGKRLQVRVTYTDDEGAGKSAELRSIAVAPEAAACGPVEDRYDTNGNGIEKSEVLAAINDYLFGGVDCEISKSEVLELINLYLFG